MGELQLILHLFLLLYFSELLWKCSIRVTLTRLHRTTAVSSDSAPMEPPWPALCAVYTLVVWTLERGPWIKRTQGLECGVGVSWASPPRIPRDDCVVSSTDKPCFSVLSFIALHRLCFLQIERLWQPCVKQICECHFPSSICSLHVSVLHFGTSCNISNPVPAKRLQLAQGSDNG